MGVEFLGHACGASRDAEKKGQRVLGVVILQTDTGGMDGCSMSHNFSGRSREVSRDHRSLFHPMCFHKTSLGQNDHRSLDQLGFPWFKEMALPTFPGRPARHVDGQHGLRDDDHVRRLRMNTRDATRGGATTDAVRRHGPYPHRRSTGRCGESQFAKGDRI